MGETALESAVLDELRVLRKDSSGIKVETLARAETICRLLGSGDPYVPYTRLQHFLLDATEDRTLRAAASSLGFASEGDTHLDRLVDAGVDLHLDQRQVRRLSDKGLAVLARLITSNWAVESVPELTAIISGQPDFFNIHLATTRDLLVEMSLPAVAVLVGSDRTEPALDWAVSEAKTKQRSVLREAITITRSTHETSVVIIWRGELWPKFTTVWQGRHADVAAESLGNKLMLRLKLSEEGA